jgi:hypothetical protein
MKNTKQCLTKAQPAKSAALAHSTETKVDTASMVDARAPQLARLLDGALDAIAASMKAIRTVVIDGKIADGGPDHYARLTGAKRLLEFTLAGRPRPEKVDREFRGATYQEIEAALVQQQKDEQLRLEQQTH